MRSYTGRCSSCVVFLNEKEKEICPLIILMWRPLGQETFCTDSMETMVSISSLQPDWADMIDFSDSAGSDVSIGGMSMKSNYSRSSEQGCCSPPAGQESLKNLQQIKWS